MIWLSAIAITLAAVAWFTAHDRVGVPTRRQRRQWKQERLDLNPAMRKRQSIPVVRP